MLQSYGCIVFDNDRGSNVIDDCFQTPLPSLQKFNPSLVLENRGQSILSTLKFKNVIQNISALRSEYVMRTVKPILQKLMSHDRNRNAFNQPVNPEELGIPQYFSVIKRPMDLGTVMSKLRGGQYHTVHACFQDIELVFNNAMYFNPWPHDIHKMAKDLLAEFRTEAAQTEEKCLKEIEKRKQHSCSLCSGESCGLCGEQCLKFEAPSLNCQQCGSRIKKNGVFYVCTDGSALWCQKCYMSLPPVIVAGAPRPLHAIDNTVAAAVSPEGTSESAADLSCFPVSTSSACEESAHTAAGVDNGAMVIGEGGDSTALIVDPSCATSTCDTDSIIHCPTDHVHNSISVSSHSSSFSSTCAGDAPLLKKNLLKRRADEEVAEPWVACDSCGNWFHQLCALYSNLGEGSASTRLFCCPYCILLASHHQSEVELDSCLAETALCASPSRGYRRRGSSSGSDDCPVQDACRIPAPMDVDLPRLQCLPPMLCIEPPKSPAPSLPTALNRLKTGLTVKFESDTLFKNIFEYSELASPTTYRSPQKPDAGDQVSIEVTRTAEEELVMTIVDAALERCVANVSANSSCAGGGLSSEDEHLLDDISVHEVCRASEAKDCSSIRMDTCAGTAADACEVEEIHMEVDAPRCAHREEDFSHHRASTAPAGTPTQDEPSTAPQQQAQSLLDAHWKWRASSLPHTQLGDFLENLVRDMLGANGHHAAAASITIRMTTNRDLPLDVPSSIVKNLVSPTGHCIPECLGYKQKCVLLFQEIDGVDVCLFSLYVHEFDATCPSPNTSTVYIAYLDSVDYFRPIAARTMVYQEIVAGYLKWSQARGFRQAHIWSCPPHRGDNFIFNAHPAHQKYPSRERLNHWYKSILSRCTKLGIIAETGNLWQQYFSKYVRRDALPSARQAALKSFVGSGMAVRKSNIKPKKKIGVPGIPAALGLTVDVSLPAAGPAGLPQSTSTADLPPLSTDITTTTITTAVSADPETSIDAPVCPPIFDGDYWVQQYVYLVRLHTQKTKGQSNATQRQQLGLRKFREVLKRLMNRDESEPFLHPVDHIALDIPQYTLIVKHPMDLNTVKEKLGAGEYPTALEFVRDVRLIFTNAKLFNPEDHPVHVAADFLSMKFEKGLTLATTELRETSSGGNGLLRMPIPGQQDSAEDASMDSFLRQIPLAFPVKDPLTQEVHAQLTAAVQQDCSEPTCRQNTGTSSSNTLCDADKSRVEFVYHTPQCKAVSRSGSLVDESEFCGSARRVHGSEEGSASPTSPRPRTQSISITPTAATSCTTPAPTSTALSAHGTINTTERVKVEAVSDSELEGDPSQRRMQHVVSQEFVGSSTIRSPVSSLDDQKKKKLNDLSEEEWTNPCSATKRRRLSEDMPSTALATEPTPPAVADTAMFSADALNSAHQAVAFVAPALGSQNTMTIVAELSKRMQRQYDDLFVIKLTPPTPANLFNEVQSVSDQLTASATAKTTSTVSAQASSKRSRGRVAVQVKRTPAMHVPGGLKCMGAVCRSLLSALTPDTSDPDPAICSPVTDSRHVFLELCQFRHYQFDSLRRAKHSSLMLLYHLQNPADKACHPVCNHCDQVIRTLRWHCDECPNFDLCAGCYAVDMAHRTGPLCLSHHPSFNVTTDTAAPVETTQTRVQVRGESALALPHPHTLTPYRISSL